MKNKNLLWLGLGAVALYLYFRNKRSASTPVVEPNSTVSTTTKAPTLPAPVNDTRPKPVNTPRPRPKNLPVLIPDKKGDDLSNPYLKMSCTDLKNMLEKEKQIRYIVDPCVSNPKGCEQKNEAYRKCGLI
jgi:hypothetical protein